MVSTIRCDWQASRNNLQSLWNETRQPERSCVDWNVRCLHSLATVPGTQRGNIITTSLLLFNVHWIDGVSSCFLLIDAKAEETLQNSGGRTDSPPTPRVAPLHDRAHSSIVWKRFSDPEFSIGGSIRASPFTLSAVDFWEPKGFLPRGRLVKALQATGCTTWVLQSATGKSLHLCEDAVRKQENAAQCSFFVVAIQQPLVVVRRLQLDTVWGYVPKACFLCEMLGIT